MADHALEEGAAGLEVGPGQIEGRHGGGAARLRLRDIGARHLADVEAVLRRPQIAGEHRHVVLAQAHDRRVAHDVAVGGDGIQQHQRFGRAQGLPAGARRRFRGIDGIYRPETAKQRLHRTYRIAARVGFGVGVKFPPVGDLLLVAGVGRAVDRGPVAGECAGHLLIGGALRCACRIEPRVELVGRC